MPEAELAGPTLRTDAQRPALSRFEPTENPRDRAHGSRRLNGLDEAERFKLQLAKLRALLSNVQTAASDEVSCGSDLFDGEMERTAAVTLHSALLELLSAVQPDELASIRVESTAATVNARFQGCRASSPSSRRCPSSRRTRAHQKRPTAPAIRMSGKCL